MFQFGLKRISFKKHTLIIWSKCIAQATVCFMGTQKGLLNFLVHFPSCSGGDCCRVLLNAAAAAASCCARVKTQRWCSRQQLIVENFVRNKSLLCFVLFSCFFSESCFTNVIVLSFIEIYKVRHHLFNHSWIPDTDVIVFFCQHSYF